MPATPTLTPHRTSTGEVVDAETLALLDELDVPLPTELADFDVDLGTAFGTPLEMHEPRGHRLGDAPVRGRGPDRPARQPPGARPRVRRRGHRPRRRRPRHPRR